MCMYQLSKCICGLSEEVYVFIGVLRSEVAINIVIYQICNISQTNSKREWQETI